MGNVSEHFDNAEETSLDATTVIAGRADKKDDKAPRKKRTAHVVYSLTAALLVAYGVGSYHFSTHFAPRTTVNGIDASGLTVEELSAALDDAVTSYSDHVSGEGFSLSIGADDVALTIDSASIATDAFGKMNQYSWPLDMVRGTNIDIDAGVSYDEELLSSYVGDAVATYNETVEPPKDATATYDKEQSAFVLVPSELGEAIDPEVVAKAAAEDLVVMDSTTLLGEEALLRAPVQDDDEALLAAIDKANAICGMTVPLTLDGKELASATPELITSWVSISEGADGPVVSVDREAIYHWSFDNMNAVVNGESETRGWEVNSRELSNALAPRLDAVDASPLEIPTITTFTRPAESEGHESRGRHVDVNLETQYARLYDSDGKTVLWRSPFVSGNLAMGHGTPTGEYTINAMERGVTLTGLNDGVVVKEGEQPKPEDYYRSYVDYWMPFIGSEYGLHDASWRWDSEFGGDTYMWNGSHGCINLPVDTAGQLFDVLHVGDVVYIHY